MEIKNIEDVKIGDMVLTHTGKFKPVLRTGGDIKETVIVNAQGIKPTETTNNHPYYVRTSKRVYTRDEVRYINGDGQIVGELCADSGAKQTNYVAISFTQVDAASDIGIDIGMTLRSGGNGGNPAHSVLTPQMVVRRLLPVECERLQGFYDGCTQIPYKGKATPDGNRYKALGNSMAVPVMRYIGQKIQEAVDYIPDSDLC